MKRYHSSRPWRIKIHLVFDIKMFTLQRKARLVADGYMTDQPKDMTYVTIVSRESVRLSFLAAALNDLDILSADIQNAYLEAQTCEKLWVWAGKEFGSNKGISMKIVRALYGLKSSGRMFRDTLARAIRYELGFQNCLADRDVWICGLQQRQIDLNIGNIFCAM